jgi:hypothetical protein
MLQFQSPVLTEAYNWTTADTVSMVIKCAESAAQVDSHLAYVVRVVSGDGATIRGVIGLFHATSTEFPTSIATIATRIHDARVDGASNFSSQVGDRIIVEIGVHGVTPSLAQVQMNLGDPSATGDYALTAGLTTDLCPWVELSRTVVFGLAAANTETSALTESVNNRAYIGAAVNTETSAASEGVNNGLRITNSLLTETSGLTDASNAEFPVNPPIEADLTETSALTDAQDRLHIQATNLTETSAGTETGNGLRQTVDDLTETSSATESQNAQKNALTAEIVETSALTEAVLGGLRIAVGNELETSALSEVGNGLRLTASLLIETTPASDSQFTTNIWTADITEVTTLADNQDATPVMSAAIVETAALAEASNWSDFVTSAEVLEASEAITVQAWIASGTPVDITETTVATTYCFVVTAPGLLSERTFVIMREDRVYAVPELEARDAVVQPESRIMSIEEGSR